MRAILKSLRRQPLGLIALCVAVSGGGAYAAQSMWTGANIVDGSLTGADVQNSSLTGADIANGSISAADLAAGATGSSPAVLDWAAPGILEYRSDGSSGPSTVQLTSQAFNVPADGFYTLYGKTTLTQVGSVCSGYYWSLIRWFVDTRFRGEGTVGLDPGTTPPPNKASTAVQLWLSAGTHTMYVFGDISCEGAGDTTGSLQAAETVVMVKPIA